MTWQEDINGIVTGEKQKSFDEGAVAGKASRDAEVAGLNTKYTQLRDEYAAYKAEKEKPTQPPIVVPSKAFGIGWSLGPGNSTIAAARKNPGWPGDDKVSVIHNYSGAKVFDHAFLKQCVDAGFIPSMSVKMKSYTHQQIVDGKADADIRASAKYIKTLKSLVLACFHHEPEDDFTTAAEQALYRAAYRHVVTIFREEGVSNVRWMPIYMDPWTFTAASKRDWKVWHADWDGKAWLKDRMMDMVGLDTYNPLPGDAPKRANKTFKAMVDMWYAAADKAGYDKDRKLPKVVMEFGTSNDADPTPDWLVWYDDMGDYIEAHPDIMLISYWDNSKAKGRYTLVGQMLAGWKSLVARSKKLAGF